MMNPLVCPNCGLIEKTYVEDREETLTVRGEPITHIVPVRICDTCGETVYDEELDAPSLDDIYAIYRRRHNLIDPQEIVEIRTQYGLSQRGLSTLLGLGDVTIHRYESGALPEEAYSHLLRALKRPETMRDVFEERQDRLSPALRRKVEARLSKLLQTQTPGLKKPDPRVAASVDQSHADESEMCERLVRELWHGLGLEDLKRLDRLPANVNRAVAERIEAGDPDLTVREIAAAAVAVKASLNFTVRFAVEQPVALAHDWDEILQSGGLQERSSLMRSPIQMTMPVVPPFVREEAAPYHWTEESVEKTEASAVAGELAYAA